MAEFIREETSVPVVGTVVVYRQQVSYLPFPKVMASKSGVRVEGGFERMDSEDKLRTFKAVLDAAWNDHRAMLAAREA